MDDVPPEIAVLIMMHGRMRPNRVPTKKWREDMVDPQLLRTHMFHRDERYTTVDDATTVAMAIELGHNDVLHHLMLCGKVRDPTLLEHALMHGNIEAAEMLYERGSRAFCWNACEKAVKEDNDEVVDWALARNRVPAVTVLVDAIEHGNVRFAQKAIATGRCDGHVPADVLYKGVKARMECLITFIRYLSPAYNHAVMENDVGSINWLSSKGVKPMVKEAELMACTEETALAVLRAGNKRPFSVVLRIMRAGLATPEELVDLKEHKWDVLNFLTS